jgi:hypothetical protein
MWREPTEPVSEGDGLGPVGNAELESDFDRDEGENLKA